MNNRFNKDDNAFKTSNIFEVLINIKKKEEPVKVQNTSSQVNTVEENMFQKYYSKGKKYNNQYKTQLDNGFTMIGRKEKQVNHELTIKNLEDDFLNENIFTNFRVLAHHNEDKNWEYMSYYNITTLNKWIDVPRFFNTLNIASGECKFTDFDIFIMKNDISPMWEDLENRAGSICSIKIDSIEEAYKIFKMLLIYILNNTLLKFSPENWQVVNGLSFSPKKIDHLNIENSTCIIVKIWFKINMSSINNSIEKSFDPKINELLSKYSIKTKPIKPEY